MNYLIIILLILMSGLFSGLTIGLLSLDKGELERKSSLGNKEAQKVYSIRNKGNLLLCTLLLGNVAVNSILSIFLGSITSGFMAGLIATGLIVLFGEIVPQATFSRYALKIGSKMTWLVKIFIFILFPICFPIAWVLDRILGDEMNTIYSRKELEKIIEEHRNSNESNIDMDEERIIRGALTFSNKLAEAIMTPRTVVYMVEEKSVLDKKLLNKIKEEGFTRIPVYRDSKDNIIGVLYAKDLINIKSERKIEDIYRKGKILTISEEEKLDDLLALFIRTKVHIAFIKNKYNGFEGIVTLEDILEEILQQEIVDETDRVTDLQKKAMNK